MNTLFVAVVTLTFLSTAEAGRGARQHARIREGVRSGQLTRGEAKGLRQEQRQLRENRKAATSDGALTKDEAASLRQQRNEASDNIHQEKHDAEVRQ